VSDKPAHMIEISDALARDVDRAREGRLKGTLPVEAFMSDAAVEQAEQQTAAASAPVHAEDLRPITAAEAAVRSTFDGETLPGHPVPRRVLPEPFRRPRIDIEHHGRQWTTCPVERITEGDMVVDVGRIARDAETVIRREAVAGVPDVAVGMKVILTNVVGSQVSFELGVRVRAFRKAELWPAEAAVLACASSTSAAGPGSRRTGTPPTST